MNIEFLILYSVLSLINVIGSTIRLLLTTNYSKDWIASLANGFYFAFYTVIIVLTTSSEISLLAKCIVTFITNVIGVYSGKLILNATRKDRLWEITATVKTSEKDEMKKVFNENDISYNVTKLENEDEVVFRIYSHNKKENRIAKDILIKSKAHYHAHESNMHF